MNLSACPRFMHIPGVPPVRGQQAGDLAVDNNRTRQGAAMAVKPAFLTKNDFFGPKMRRMIGLRATNPVALTARPGLQWRLFGYDGGPLGRFALVGGGFRGLPQNRHRPLNLTPSRRD
jgi:hypothetical protein